MVDESPEKLSDGSPSSRHKDLRLLSVIPVTLVVLGQSCTEESLEESDRTGFQDCSEESDEVGVRLLQDEELIPEDGLE